MSRPPGTSRSGLRPSRYALPRRFRFSRTTRRDEGEGRIEEEKAGGSSDEPPGISEVLKDRCEDNGKKKGTGKPKDRTNRSTSTRRTEKILFALAEPTASAAHSLKTPPPTAPTLHPSPMTTTCPPDPPEFPEEYASAVGLRLSPFCMFLIATVFSSRQQDCHHPRPAGGRSSPPAHAHHGRLHDRGRPPPTLPPRSTNSTHPSPPDDLPTSSTAALTHHRRCSSSTISTEHGSRPSHQPNWPADRTRFSARRTPTRAR